MTRLPLSQSLTLKPRSCPTPFAVISHLCLIPALPRYTGETQPGLKHQGSGSKGAQVVGQDKIQEERRIMQLGHQSIDVPGGFISRVFLAFQGSLGQFLQRVGSWWLLAIQSCCSIFYDFVQLIKQQQTMTPEQEGPGMEGGTAVSSLSHCMQTGICSSSAVTGSWTVQTVSCSLKSS